MGRQRRRSIAANGGKLPELCGSSDFGRLPVIEAGHCLLRTSRVTFQLLLTPSVLSLVHRPFSPPSPHLLTLLLINVLSPFPFLFPELLAFLCSHQRHGCQPACALSPQQHQYPRYGKDQPGGCGHLREGRLYRPRGGALSAKSTSRGLLAAG